MGSCTAQSLRRVRAYTLCQLEIALACWVPARLFPKASAKEKNSRDHHYTRWRSFWCMLWQALNPEASGREVVRQLQALFELEEGPTLSEEDGAYGRAKARLPLAEFPKALAAIQAPGPSAPPLALDPASGNVHVISDRPCEPADAKASLSLPGLVGIENASGALKVAAQEVLPQTIVVLNTHKTIANTG